MLRAVLLMLAVVLVAGCATPTQRVDRIAAAAGMQRSVIDGERFQHVVFSRGAPLAGRVVHVYLEGDGTPYLNRTTAAPDPTPRNPLMLQLMADDPAPAVYVGRPCYYGLAASPGCTPLQWTLRRFSPEIVDSMQRAIERATDGAAALELYGYSGGAALAVALARRLDGVVRVVTLAGNLDPNAWTTLHRYSPLEALVDPLEGGRLPQAIRQLHVAGELDRNVPRGLIQDAARRLGASDVRVQPGADHACCWREAWPSLRDGIVAPQGGV